MDVDIVAQDLSNSVQPSFNNCLAVCSANSNCTHISYRYTTGGTNPSPQGTCWLKYGPVSQNNTVTSIGVQAAILNQSKYSILNDMINFRF
jgi:hypothetical protein